MKKKNRWYCFLCKQRFPKSEDERAHIKKFHMSFRDMKTIELQNQWIVDELEELYEGIAGALAFSEKTDPLEAYEAFMNFTDKLIDKIYKKEGIKRPVYTLSENKQCK